MENDRNPATAELPPSLPSPHTPPWVGISEMEIHPIADVAASAVCDWKSFIDFTIDEEDSLMLSWGSSKDGLMPIPAEADPPPLPPAPVLVTAGPAGEGNNRVRKRDPRLVCPNYLAGTVPCACPEVDELELAEEDVAAVAAGGRKRARTRGAAAAVARCQVRGCEADIRELKGYHRRHRVCLRCANASYVVLDAEHKRYCQQCGK